MNKVDQYIENQNKIILEDRENTLIALGLVEKEYSPHTAETWKYPKYEYVNGEKRYYREVAIQVTDEEYALIVSKANQVEAIKNKKEQEQLAKWKKGASVAVKKWIPIFEKPKGEFYLQSETNRSDTGRSVAARSIRIICYTLFLIALVGAIIFDISKRSIISPFVVIAELLGIVFVEGLASILDYLAELTAIARNGFKYTEKNK